MPSLPQELLEPTQEAAETSGDFTAMDPGVYTARLGKCDADRTRDGKKAMWKLEFDQIYDLDGTKKGGRLWSNITLEESVAWKIAQFFAAFGVPTSTNTDEMINVRCRLEVSKRVQEFGKNKGKEVNDIDRFVALAESDDGYEKAQQLKARLTKKAAPAKSSAVPDDAATEIAEMNEDEGDLEF